MKKHRKLRFVLAAALAAMAIYVKAESPQR